MRRGRPAEDGYKQNERVQTVYVRASDQSVWSHARQNAQARGLSLATIVTLALRRYLAQQGDEA